MKKFNFIQFKKEGESFLSEIYKLSMSRQINLQNIECDHLCFRVHTDLEYKFFKNELSHYAQLLIETTVNGRLISTFKLNQPFKTPLHSVYLIELPEPKPGSTYKTGFEHAEFVIAESFESLQSRHLDLNFTEKGNKIINPELCLQLTDDICIKFHYQSLEKVIEIENSKIKNIIFDLDGTLIHSRENIYLILQLTLNQMLNQQFSLSEIKTRYHSDFNNLFQEFNLTTSEQQIEFINIWRLNSTKFKYNCFDDVKKMLNTLKKYQFKLHLWTARDPYSAKFILRQNKIENIFESFSYSDLIYSKPNAKSLNLEWNKLNKNETIMIGDSHIDVIAAKNISAWSAFATWDNHSQIHEGIKYGANLFFSNPNEFLQFLTKNGVQNDEGSINC